MENAEQYSERELEIKNFLEFYSTWRLQTQEWEWKAKRNIKTQYQLLPNE